MAQSTEIGTVGATWRAKLAALAVILVGVGGAFGVVRGDVAGWQWAIGSGHPHQQALGDPSQLPATSRLSTSQYRDANMLAQAVAAVARLKSHDGKLPTPYAAQQAIAQDPLFSEYHSYMVKDVHGALSSEGNDKKNEIDVQFANRPGTLSLFAPSWGGTYAISATMRADRQTTYQELVVPDNFGQTLAMVFLTILSTVALAFLVFADYSLVGVVLEQGAARSAWRRLVDSPLLGPSTPRQGFELKHPEKEARRDADGEQVRFIARRYRFDGQQWQDRGEDANLSSGWLVADDVSALVEKWIDFCNRIAKQNVHAWTSSLEGRRGGERQPQAIDAGLSVVNLLPDARTVVDLGAYRD